MIKKIFFALFFFQLILTATPALAATEICFNPQISIPGMEKVFKETCKDASGNFAGYKIDGLSIGNFILVMFKYLLGIVGILSAIIMMIAGVLWLTAGGNSQRVTEAQGYIKGSLSGLLLTLFSFTILATINPDLVSFKSISLKNIKKAIVSPEDRTISNTLGNDCRNNVPDCAYPLVCKDGKCSRNENDETISKSGDYVWVRGRNCLDRITYGANYCPDPIPADSVCCKKSDIPETTTEYHNACVYHLDLAGKPYFECAREPGSGTDTCKKPEDCNTNFGCCHFNAFWGANCSDTRFENCILEDNYQWFGNTYKCENRACLLQH